MKEVGAGRLAGRERYGGLSTGAMRRREIDRVVHSGPVIVTLSGMGLS